MLTHDPIPWLIAQDGLAAVRARRLLGLDREGDAEVVQVLVRELADEQVADGSFAGSFARSPMKTAGALNLLDDLHADGAGDAIAAGASYLFSVLQSQPGYARARSVAREFIRDGLSTVASKQRKNGTFGTSCQIERVAAVLVAFSAIQ